MPLLTIFPDSNVFVHFQPIENWNWEILIDKHFEIALASSIIGELDKIKYSANTNKIRHRIQELVRKFKQSDNLNFNGLQFKIHASKKDVELMSRHNLDKEDMDDVFLSCVLKYISDYPNEEVLIVSNDFGLLLKCRALKIQCLQPPEQYLIIEEDKEAREIKKLNAEIRAIKNALPKLELKFDNGSSTIQFDFHNPVTGASQDISAKLKILKSKYPPHSEKQKAKSQYLSTLKDVIISPERIEKYNSELQEYFSKYESYLWSESAALYIKQLTIELNIKLENSGTAPANDIDLELHFPDGFVLTTQLDSEKSIKEPEPPKLFHLNFDMPDFGGLYIPSPINFNASIPDLSGFSIKKTNSYLVENKFINIKHNDFGSIRTLYCAFESYESASSYNIEYTIRAANIPNKIEGELEVLINRKSTE